jgi:EmrB/QacA subfamily drug resistance transporter
LSSESLPEDRSAAAASSSRYLPLLVAGAFFMENLDATVITTALPEMARSFGVAPAQLSIGISAYLLALAVFIPLSGWLADRFGPRRVFGSAIAIFTLASLACGLATTLETFTAARILQGIGGAMMVPVGRLVVLRGTSKKDLLRAISTITWPGLAAPVIGPPIGGFITTHFGWHWIFYLNIPLGIVGFVLALRWVRGAPGGRRPFDKTGFVLSALGCIALMIGLELASQMPLQLPLVAAMLAVGVVGIALTVRHMKRVPHPLVDVSALPLPTFAVNVIGGSLFRISIGSAPFLLPLMFQLAFGLSAVTAGMLMLALFAGNLLIKPSTTWTLRRFGFRRVLVVNGLLVAAGFLACAMLTPDTPIPVMAVILFFCGACRSMQFTALNTIAFADVKPAQMSGSTALFSMLQQMNAGIGVALGAVALQVAEHLTGDATSAHPSVLDFRIALVVMSALAALAVINAMRLPRHAGAEVSGHKARAAA